MTAILTPGPPSTATLAALQTRAGQRGGAGRGSRSWGRLWHARVWSPNVLSTMTPVVTVTMWPPP